MVKDPQAAARGAAPLAPDEVLRALRGKHVRAVAVDGYGGFILTVVPHKMSPSAQGRRIRFGRDESLRFVVEELAHE